MKSDKQDFLSFHPGILTLPPQNFILIQSLNASVLVL